MIKYTVYKTTNLVNGKIYIGVHKQSKPKDYYIGSGAYFKRAYKKYGRDNFSKEILFVYNSSSEAYSKEAELVTEEFVSKNDNYNLIPGGIGGPGKKLSKEHIQAIIESKIGIPRTQEVKDKISKTRLEKKIPSPNKNKKLSEDHCRALSLAKLGSKGPPMPDTTRAALLKALSGPRTQEFKDKFKKKLLIHGVIYNSCTEVAKEFNISNSLVSFRLKSDKWDWTYYDSDKNAT